MGLFGAASSYLGLCYAAFGFLRDHCRQHEGLQIANLDAYFDEAYKSSFIFSDGEDLRARWSTVRPKIGSMMRAVSTIADLPSIKPSAIARINEVVKDDVWYLRQLAKLLRGAES